MTLKLSGPVPGDDVLREFFGDQAGEVKKLIANAEAEDQEDVSVDHEAEIARFRKLAGHSGFVQGQLPPPALKRPSMAYGANEVHRPLSPAARTRAENREVGTRYQNPIER